MMDAQLRGVKEDETPECVKGVHILWGRMIRIAGGATAQCEVSWHETQCRRAEKEPFRMTVVTIRRARAADAQHVRDLERMIVEASLPIVRELRSGAVNANSVGATIDDALRLVAVAGGDSELVEERVVGLIALTVRLGTAGQVPHAHIRALAVAAAYRRRGVGMRLLERAESWVRDRGMTRLATTVDEGNQAALAFFTCAGYYGERGLLVKELEVAQADLM